MLKMGELYLKGDVDLFETNYHGQTQQIFNKIKAITADISQAGSSFIIYEE